MTDAGPHLVHDLIVALDNGQFGAMAGHRPHVGYMDFLAKAQSGLGIASYECGVVLPAGSCEPSPMAMGRSASGTRSPDVAAASDCATGGDVGLR